MATSELSQFDEDALMLIKEAISFSRDFLMLSENIQIGIADYSSGLFEHPDVPCFTRGSLTIVFNRDWLRRSLPEHSDDVRFFTFHELRHIHQQNVITMYRSGQSVDEKPDVIERWEYEFKNYKTNLGDDSSQAANLSQDIEQDANGYGIALLTMQFLGSDKEYFELSLPAEAFNAAEIRSDDYCKTRPELKRYIAKKQREITGVNPVGRRPEPYSPWPCGSGQKFKFCCYKKGIYD